MIRRFAIIGALAAVLAAGLLNLRGDASANVITISGARGSAPSSGGGSADFTTRCAASGVLKCVDFDDDGDFNTGAGGSQGAWGDRYGVMPISGTSTYRVVRDSSVKKTGTSSMRFDISGSDNQDNGSWFTNFTDDLSYQVGEGQGVYVQWRERIDSTILSTNYFQADGVTKSDGIKLSDISAGDTMSCTRAGANSTLCPTSCWDFEVVTQNQNQEGMPRTYANCGGNSAWLYQPMNGFTSNTTVQNGVGCLYPSYASPPCIRLFGNEWMTFQVHIAVGHWNQEDSTIQVWVAREGQASVLVVDCSPTATDKCRHPQTGVAMNGWRLNSTDTNYKIGKVWLLPYHTNRCKEGAPNGTHDGMCNGGAGSYADTNVWYDDLIISTQHIADPSSAVLEYVPLRAANDAQWELAA